MTTTRYQVPYESTEADESVMWFCMQMTKRVKIQARCSCERPTFMLIYNKKKTAHFAKVIKHSTSAGNVNPGYYFST